MNVPVSVPHPPTLVMAIAVGVLLGGFALWFILGRWKASAGQSAGESGGLNYVVGPMGSGKSMFGVRTIVTALVSGRSVITNVRLYDGWESMVCKREFPADFRNADRRARRPA